MQYENGGSLADIKPAPAKANRSLKLLFLVISVLFVVCLLVSMATLIIAVSQLEEMKTKISDQKASWEDKLEQQKLSLEAELATQKALLKAELEQKMTYLDVKIEQQKEKLQELQVEVRYLATENHTSSSNIVTKRYGVVYTRWGRKTCGDNSSLIYEGNIYLFMFVYYI